MGGGGLGDEEDFSSLPELGRCQHRMKPLTGLEVWRCVLHSRWTRQDLAGEQEQQAGDRLWKGLMPTKEPDAVLRIQGFE
jgi:hypothetical protein